MQVKKIIMFCNMHIRCHTKLNPFFLIICIEIPYVLSNTTCNTRTWARTSHKHNIEMCSKFKKMTTLAFLTSDIH